MWPRNGEARPRVRERASWYDERQATPATWRSTYCRMPPLR